MELWSQPKKRFRGPLDEGMQVKDNQALEALRTSFYSYPLMLCTNLQDGWTYQLSKDMSEWVRFQATGPQGDKGDRGATWYLGTRVTGEGEESHATGINSVMVGDAYFNTHTGGIYTCTKAGNQQTAIWKYLGKIQITSEQIENTGITLVDQSTDNTPNTGAKLKDILSFVISWIKERKDYPICKTWTGVFPSETLSLLGSLVLDRRTKNVCDLEMYVVVDSRVTAGDVILNVQELVHNVGLRQVDYQPTQTFIDVVSSDEVISSATIGYGLQLDSQGRVGRYTGSAFDWQVIEQSEEVFNPNTVLRIKIKNAGYTLLS